MVVHHVWWRQIGTSHLLWALTQYSSTVHRDVNVQQAGNLTTITRNQTNNNHKKYKITTTKQTWQEPFPQFTDFHGLWYGEHCLGNALFQQKQPEVPETYQWLLALLGDGDQAVILSHRIKCWRWRCCQLMWLDVCCAVVLLGDIVMSCNQSLKRWWSWLKDAATQCGVVLPCAKSQSAVTWMVH